MCTRSETSGPIQILSTPWTTWLSRPSFFGMKRTIDFPAGDANDPNLDSDAELVGSAPDHYTMAVTEWLVSNFELEVAPTTTMRVHRI